MRLPNTSDSLELLSPLGHSCDREIYSAVDVRRPDNLVVVELVWGELPTHITKNQTANRFALELSGWGSAGGPSYALVTVLPVSLPIPGAEFRLLSFVGAGGMGQVWMATSPNFPDIPLAIKFVTHPAFANNPGLIEQCRQEVRLGITVRSEHLLPTLHSLELPNRNPDGWPTCAIVMQLVLLPLGKVLEDLEKRKEPLPAEVALRIVEHILRGVDKLHEHHFVHRDLKPMNVLLSLPPERPYRGAESLRNSTAMISDFGAACVIGKIPSISLQQDGWKAPELFRSDDSTIPEANSTASFDEDWYSFGTILLSILELVDGKDLSILREIANRLTHVNVEDRVKAVKEVKRFISPVNVKAQVEAVNEVKNFISPTKEMWEEVYRDCHLLARMYKGRGIDQDDLVQEVMSRCWSERSLWERLFDTKLRRGSLKNILRETADDFFRRERRERKKNTTLPADLVSHEQTEPAIDTRDLLASLLSSSKFSESDRRLLDLRITGSTLQEIATELGISLRSTHVRLVRIYERLRALLHHLENSLE